MHADETPPQESWVIGMRPNGPGGESWARLLYYRLTGQHHRTTAGARTSESEQALNIEQSIYFFIGRCVPDFGDTGVANARPSGGGLTAVPFDTGGMAQGKIQTDPPLTPASRAEIVRHWSLDEPNFSSEFPRWGARAYTSSAEYTEGLPPKQHLVAEIVISSDKNEARAWTWEGRVPSKQHACSLIQPLKVVLSDRLLDQYRTWIKYRGLLEGPEYANHVRFLSSIRLDPGKLGGCMALNQYLEGVAQWQAAPT